MFEISTKSRFSAAHHLAGYPGSCAALHGHNWEVEVFVVGEKLNETGILVDFRLVREALRDTLRELDHTDLNTVPEFATQNPTSEHLARYLFGKLSSRINARDYRVSRVSVYETPESRATYWDGGLTAHLPTP